MEIAINPFLFRCMGVALVNSVKKFEQKYRPRLGGAFAVPVSGTNFSVSFSVILLISQLYKLGIA